MFRPMRIPAVFNRMWQGCPCTAVGIGQNSLGLVTLCLHGVPIAFSGYGFRILSAKLVYEKSRKIYIILVDSN